MIKNTNYKNAVGWIESFKSVFGGAVGVFHLDTGAVDKGLVSVVFNSNKVDPGMVEFIAEQRYIPDESDLTTLTQDMEMFQDLQPLRQVQLFLFMLAHYANDSMSIRVEPLNILKGIDFNQFQVVIFINMAKWESLPN